MARKPPSLPAARDPNRLPNGNFAPGNSASPGRPKGLPNFKTLFASLPDDEEGRRATVAKTLGCDVGEVPYGLDRLGLLLWMREQQAFRGHEGAMADVFDRALPKPRRHEHSGPDGGPMAFRSPVGGSGVSADAAEDYYHARDRVPEPE